MKRSIKKAIVIATICFAMFSLVAFAQSQRQARVFSLISATLEPGQMAEYASILENDILPILKRNDVELIGVFNNSIGGASNEVLILVAYKDFAHIQKANQDADLLKFQQERFEKMRVLNSRLLAPMAFSPLQ